MAKLSLHDAEALASKLDDLVSSLNPAQVAALQNCNPSPKTALLSDEDQEQMQEFLDSNLKNESRKCFPPAYSGGNPSLTSGIFSKQNTPE